MNISTENAHIIVEDLVKYMEQKGLIFKSKNINGPSPYAILSNLTSVGYRRKARNGKSGVVFYCSKDRTDMLNLTQKLGIEADYNNDAARPYAVFIPDNMIEDAIEILTLNLDNMSENITMQKTESLFKTIKEFKNNVTLVENSFDDSYYVRKEYAVYNREVFERVKRSNISGIPHIYEICENNGKLYTLEEYIEGETLQQIFNAKGVFNEKEVIYIAIELCKILKQLHNMMPPLLHRDIKPSNIILDRDSKVFLIDFNATKELHAGNSEDTILYGTQYFGAPEQLLGYGVSTPSTDIFGLGATLSYLLTGVYYTQMIAPGKLSSIFTKCTSMDWKNRYQTADELLEEIEKVIT